MAAEYMQKKAAWESKRGARAVLDADAKSDCTEATVSTMASEPIDREEVRAIAAQDKDVRRCEKKLRDVLKLKQRAAEGELLDALQVAKLAQEGEVKDLLDEAWGLAQARAREQLRRQA